MNTIKYIEMAKTKLKTGSNYGLSKATGISEQCLSRYKSGKGVMDDYTAAKIAEVLEISPLEVIAAANAEREKNSEKRKFWEKLARVTATAAIAMPLYFGNFSEEGICAYNSTSYTLCAIRFRVWAARSRAYSSSSTRPLDFPA